MEKWFLSLLLIGVVLVSGCLEEEYKPEYHDNALKMEYEITERIEKTRILPGQPIRMVVYLTNQVENDITDIDMRISNPYGIGITRVDCGLGCVCEGGSNDCNNKPLSCDFNGCLYDNIQSLDEVEINFALNIPTEEEIASVGYELKPELTLKYNYDGQSMLYIPILKYGEKPPTEKMTEFTQTTGPIHVDITSDKWVRGGNIFPLFVKVKDVVNPGRKIILDRGKFKLHSTHIPEFGGSLGRCDFEPCSVYSGDNNHDGVIDIVDVATCARYGCNWNSVDNTCYGAYIPEKNIELPMEDPLVCTLKAEVPQAPMVKAMIRAEYSYRYKVEKTETIRVEKGLL